jgi:hypothetical protein
MGRRSTGRRSSDQGAQRQPDGRRQRGRVRIRPERLDEECREPARRRILRGAGSGTDAAGVSGVRVGDEVFGAPEVGARGSNAEYAVLAAWAPKPAAWGWAEAGGATGAVETSTRVLDRLAVGAGDTLLVQGAAGGTGSVAVQLAVVRGVR